MEVIRLRTLALVSAFVLAGFGLGCEKDQGNNGEIIPSSDTGTSDAGDTDEMDGDDMDAGDTTAEDGGDTSEGDTEDPDAGDTGDTGDTDDGTCSSDDDCEGEQICVEEVCQPLNVFSKCAAAEDLGEIAADSSVTASGDFQFESDAFGTTCADSEEAPETVFAFTVAEDSVVSFTTDWISGQYDAKVEFRLEDCPEPANQQVQCFDADTDVFLTAGTQAYLVVEQDVGRGGPFEVELTATPEDCPAGARVCEADKVRFCTGEGNFDEYQCADGCAGGVCNGDACGNAIEVTADATFSGSNSGYDNDFNFDGNSLCTADGGTNVPTPGADQVFEFPNLTAGDTLFIDAETNDSNNNAIFITSACSASPSCDEVRVVNERGEWEVPADGTYYVIIDKLTVGAQDFAYSFEIR